ncbi:MAG: hypothetical protein H0U74_12290 [Bradymonadaceae bacterium]|nr:hypothetical protein [Lujinxingiaceae bacterium]
MRFHTRAPRLCRLGLGFLALLLLIGTGCATGSATDTGWPQVAVMPQAPPSDLDLSSSSTTLRRASDGFWYVVGALDAEVTAGSAFMGRFSGEWPLKDLPRPPLAAGHVLHRYSDQVALVGLTYSFPETELSSLEITWERSLQAESLGKGLGTVMSVKLADQNSLKISIGDEAGVQAGDIYAVLGRVAPGTATKSLQLSRRLVAVCMASQTEETNATCRQWNGHISHPASALVNEGDEVVFLEHSFGKPPRDATILVSQIEGHQSARDALVGGLKNYLSVFGASNATVVLSDLVVEATDIDFHRNSQRIDYEGSPVMFVGASVHLVEGREHLFVNYTGVGPATGPGMVAAPPEHGIDLGAVKNLNADAVRAFAAVVTGAVMVYRGQTSEAMMHLHSLLRDKAVAGPLRWHARDQFAMRWAALGYYEEALWLVLEDEAVAAERDDEQATLNAMGTRVRLYDYLTQHETAYETARNYLKARVDQKPNSAYLSALGMYGEMALRAGKPAPAQEVVRELRELCPDGCGSDLSSFLAGVFWAAGTEDEALQDEVLGVLVELARDGDSAQMASVRLYQGLTFMRERELEQALIAFLESERLYEQARYRQGVARARYFMFLTQMAREEPQDAFEHALKALDHNTDLGDFEATVRIYERMTQLYADIDLSAPPRPYLGAARRMLGAAVQSQLAMGHYAKASEAMFGMGSFFFKIGSLPESQLMFQQTVWYGLRTARFDVVALSHLFLGIIARNQGDMETFQDEIQRAMLMAEAAQDPGIREVIESALNPPVVDDVPTQLL